MKKLSLKSVFKESFETITEADILNKNQELKNSVVQELPGYLNAFMQQIKSDKYQEAMITLDAIIDTSKKIQQEMNHILNSNKEQTLSNSEL